MKDSEPPIESFCRAIGVKMIEFKKFYNSVSNDLFEEKITGEDFKRKVNVWIQNKKSRS